MHSVTQIISSSSDHVIKTEFIILHTRGSHMISPVLSGLQVRAGAAHCVAAQELRFPGVEVRFLGLNVVKSISGEFSSASGGRKRS